MLFDTHAHLNREMFEEDIDTIIKNAFDNDVSYIIINSYDIDSSYEAVKLANEYANIYAAVGIHPSDVKRYKLTDLAFLHELVKDPKVVAIGEIGLDYYHDKDNKQQQIEFFKAQLAIAKQYDLPVTIHCREAVSDTYDVLQAADHYGVMHCYSSSAQMAKRFIDINFYISLAGPVTFKNAKESVEVAQTVSLDKLLIETDSPFLAPHPLRGTTNQPANVKLIAKKIADIKNLSYEEVAMQTTNNALELFKIGAYYG